MDLLTRDVYPNEIASQFSGNYSSPPEINLRATNLPAGSIRLPNRRVGAKPPESTPLGIDSNRPGGFA